MSFKLAFRFNRLNYSPDAMRAGDEEIKTKLKVILDAGTINFNHMYAPARNSIKLIFPNEAEIEKILEMIHNRGSDSHQIKLSAQRVFNSNFLLVIPVLLTPLAPLGALK